MVIDFRDVIKAEVDDGDGEGEKLYCKHCRGSVELWYCNKDNNDKSLGPICRKGDYECPRCGNIYRDLSKKKKEQKGPKLSTSRQSTTPKGFIEVFSTHANYGILPSKEKEEPDIDRQWDEMLETQGVKVSSETYFPESGRRVKI